MEQLQKTLRGRLVRPGDADYEQARRVWNGMIDKKPKAIVQCRETSDVVASVNFARDNDLRVAVRGGGHNVSGYATCDDGLVIDLGPMKGITVDPDRRISRAEGGLTWGEYDKETHRHGLASPGGAISTTGIAGLTLGGGFGWISRSYGLACDNVVSAEVVTADGEVRAAGPDENPDLFWGIRGGGGNFGVVTRFDYRLQPVRELYAGLVLYPRSEASRFMAMYAGLTAEAPDELSSMAAFLHTPDGVPVVGAFVVYHGSAEDGERALSRLRAFGPPIVDDIAIKPYPVVQQAFDPGFPAGLRNYWKSNYLKALSGPCIEAIVDWANKAASPLSIVGIEHMLGGAVGRIGPQETAFASRDAVYNALLLSMHDAPGDDEANRRWARDAWTALQPFSTGAVYVNYMSADDKDRVGEAYGSTNYGRLVELKRKYDPGNVFRLNQNITP